MAFLPTANEDRELVGRLKRRDPQSMTVLYDRFGKLAYSIIYRAVHNEATAEDLLQETFFRVWNRVHTFDEERGQFEAWLVTVARNRAFDYLRSQRREPVPVADWADLEQAGLFIAHDSADDRMLREDAVGKALDRLSADQREIMELTHFEGLSQTEIAARLGKPLGTVKGLVRSALKSLRAVAARGEAL